MRIAVFASAYAPHVGGVEQVVHQLAVEHRKAGHDPFVVTNRWPRDLPAYEVLDGIAVYRPALRWPVGPRKASLSYHLTHRRILDEVCEIVTTRHADVLHVQCVSANGLYALECKRRLGVPLVVTAHGEVTMDAGAIFQRHRFVHELLDALATEADAFTACSARTLRDVEEYLGRRLGSKAQVIHNGTDLGEFDSVHPRAAARPYIFAAGRLVAQKGFDVLLEAYARTRPDMDLVIAGDGPELDHLRDRADELGVADDTELVGALDRRRVAAFFCGAAFVVVPSTADEGLPLVVLEAMAAGRPLVVTQTGGVLEVVVPDESAIVVPRGDVGALGDAMRRIADDAELGRRLGAAARRRVAGLTWARVADSYLQVYELAREHS